MWDHLNWLKAQKEKSLEGALRYYILDIYLEILNI